MLEIVRESMIVFAACVVVACVGASPQPVAPASSERAPSASPQRSAPEAAAAAQPDCTACFRDGEKANADGDPVRALSLFESGCQRGEGSACHAAAGMYATGDGVPEDDPRAVELYIRACGLDNGQACADVGIPMINSEARGAEGRVLLAKGCEGGHAVSCNYLGAAHQQGLGGPVDHAASARAVSRSCELGNALGCTHYGIAFHRGQGVPADPSKAREYYERACDGGEPMACGNLGIALRDGIGGPADMSRAVSTFERGCERGSPVACAGLGVAFVRGEGGRQVDVKRALELFELACKGGDRVACDNAEKLTSAGVGTQAEPQWTTKVGSLTIGVGDQTATFKDVRSTCSPFPLSLAFGVVAGDVRECLGDSDARRVSVAVQGGQLVSSSVEPDDAVGRCVTSALGRARLGDLTCAFEATVSR